MESATHGQRRCHRPTIADQVVVEQMSILKEVPGSGDEEVSLELRAKTAARHEPDRSWATSNFHENSGAL